MSTRFAGAGSFLANSSLSAFRGVSLSTNGGVGYSTNSEIPIGYSSADAASGDYVGIRFTLGSQGNQKGVASGAVTVGDTLYAATNGRVCSTGTITVGKSMSTAADAAVIEFVVLR